MRTPSPLNLSAAAPHRVRPDSYVTALTGSGFLEQATVGAHLVVLAADVDDYGVAE